MRKDEKSQQPGCNAEAEGFGRSAQDLWLFLVDTEEGSTLPNQKQKWSQSQNNVSSFKWENGCTIQPSSDKSNAETRKKESGLPTAWKKFQTCSQRICCGGQKWSQHTDARRLSFLDLEARATTTMTWKKQQTHHHDMPGKRPWWIWGWGWSWSTSWNSFKMTIW